MTDLLSPMEMQAQQQAIERNRKIAEMLQMSSMQAPQGQMVSGHYIKSSPLEYIAKLAQGLMGTSQLKDIDAQSAKLMAGQAEAQKQDRINAMQKYSDALMGKPAVPGENLGQGDSQRQMAYMEHAGTVAPDIVTPGQAAVPGNPRAAAMQLMQANDPALQKFGMEQILKQREPANNFNKVDPKDYDPASVAKFAQTGNYADLVPVRKREVGPAGQVYDPYSVQPGMVLADPNKPFSAGPNGVVPNAAYQQYELGKAKAGKTDINVKTDIKMNEGIASQVGPMMRDSQVAAAGAVQQIDAANRMIQAVDTNKLFSGPTATLRLKGAQIADAIGIGGKDNAEKIANTRQAVRAMAEMTLQGRKSMRGEGAITESEGKLAERAFSGDIDSLTAAEIKQIAKASKRFAEFQSSEHSRKLEQMKKTPGLEGIVPFYDVGKPESPEVGGWSIKQVP